MSHTVILLACLSLGWGLALVALWVAPRLARPGDRRALHQLALFAPLLSLGLAGAWGTQMALTGCPMFTPADAAGTVALAAGLGALLGVSAVRETWHVGVTRRRLEAIATHPADALADLPLPALAAQVGVRVPRIRLLETPRAIACVAGIVHPTLYLSQGMVAALARRELEALVAHELAHLRHQDNLLAWLDVIVFRTFAFVSPLRTAWEESLAEREEFADSVAAHATGRPKALASALLKVAALPGPAEGTLVGAAGFASHGERLERRIDRLLAAAPVRQRSWGGPALGALAIALSLPFLTAWALGSYTACMTHLPLSEAPHGGAGH